MTKTLIFIFMGQCLLPHLKFPVSGKLYLVETKDKNDGNGNKKSTKLVPKLTTNLGRSSGSLEDSDENFYGRRCAGDDGSNHFKEGNCTEWCQANAAEQELFICKSGDQCVYSQFRCDGYPNHCKDGSDEVGCTDWCHPNVTQNWDMNRDLKCATGTRCIYGHHRCNGELDCEDGSDEANCAEPCRANSAPKKKVHV